MRTNEIRGSNSKKLKKNGAGCCFFMMAFRFSVLLQLSSCTYVYNYFSENARIKFIPKDADVSGVVMD